MTRFSFRRSVAFFVLSVGALAALMTTRSVIEARAEFVHAERSLASQDLANAVVHLRLAARWDAPFNVYAERALDQLERIGQAAEQRGDAFLALRAYRGLHAALHATRGIHVSDAARLARVDARIAALMAAAQPAPLTASLSPKEREQRYRALLTPPSPNALGVLLACGGFFTWVLAFAALILRGLDNEGRIVKAVARPTFLLLVFGWVLFAVGLQIA